MFCNGRKTIGVFLGRPVEYFQKELGKGIADRAESLGYNVAIFSTCGCYTRNEGYTIGQKTIFSLPQYENLDGVILALDTFDVEDMRTELIEKVQSRCTCPVVSIRRELPGYHNIMVDDHNCMNGMINHFIEHHQAKTICFMSGPKGYVDADRHLESFKRQMALHNLPLEDWQIFYGDFWKNKGQEASDQFLSHDKRPDAIICANDYMAIALSSVLIERGLSIPEDIAIFGYDGIIETKIANPSVTSVVVPFRKMGSRAVDIIDSGKNDKEINGIEYFSTELELAESCGCVTGKSLEVMKKRSQFISEIELNNNRRSRNTFMSINLEEIESFSQLESIIARYIDDLGNYRHFHMCLCDGVDNKSRSRVPRRYTPQMNMRISVLNQKMVPNVNVPFDIKDLLPKEATDDDPQCYFFMPLHYKERCFGYTATSFWEGRSFENMYQSWTVNIGNAIQDIMIRRKMQKLIDELEDMYVRDVLTSLYNRRGFEKYSVAKFSEAVDHKHGVFIAGIDLDGLKQINDNYGHSEGDYAIRMVADALKESSTHGEICARMGGDEFSVAAFNLSEEEANQFVEHFNHIIKEFNDSKERPYEINASIGIIYKVPGSCNSLEEYMRISDDLMYQCKAKRKKEKKDQEEH